MKRLMFGYLALASACFGQRVIGCIGDSITAGYNSSPAVDPCTILATDLTAFTGQTWTTNNQGVIGTSSNDWVSGSANLNAAISAFTPASVNYVLIMLGTNDAKTALQTPQATYQSNLSGTIAALKTAGFNQIVLNYSPYINTNSNGWTIAGSNPYLLQYQTALNALAAADPTHVIVGDATAYSFFQNNTGLLGDGVHPTNTGYADLGQFWATAFQNNFVIVPLPTSSTWTGYLGNAVSITVTPPATARVCYTLDGYPLISPGGAGSGGPANGAQGATGCVPGTSTSNFPFPVNAENYGNGTHVIGATAYDAIGNTLASGTATVTIANPWPCSWTPALSVSVTPNCGSNWCGMQSVTATATGTHQSDDANFYFYIDGVLQYEVDTGTNSATFAFDTTQFPGGRHYVAVVYNDNSTTNCSVYNGGSLPYGHAGEWVSYVNFAQSAPQPAYVQLSAKNVYLAPTNSVTLVPALVNTDGSTSHPTFYFASANASVATVCASPCSGSSTTLTAVANGAAQVYTMAGAVSLVDGYACNVGGVPGGGLLCSSSYVYKQSDLNKMLCVTSGTGSLPGCYSIGLLQFNGGLGLYQIKLTALGTNGGVDAWTSQSATGIHFTYGPTDSTWAQVNPTNTMWCNGTDQQIHQGPDPRCMFVASGFYSSFMEDPPYRSISGAYPGVGEELNNSGFNTLEYQVIGPPVDVTLSTYGNTAGDQANFTTQLGSYISRNMSIVNTCFKCYVYGLNDNMWGTWGPLVYDTAGKPSQWVTPPMQIIMSSWMGNKMIGMRPMDEVTYIYAVQPLQGPIRPASSGSNQNWLKNIASNGIGTCTANIYNTGPGGKQSLLGNGFIITGSATSGMNNTPGTGAPYSVTGTTSNTFTFNCAGVASGTYGWNGSSNTDPNLTIQPLSGYYGPWVSANNYYFNWDGFAKITKESTAASTIPIQQGTRGDDGPFLTCLWAGGAGCQQSITVGGTAINNVSPGGANVYNDTSSTNHTYLLSRLALYAFANDYMLTGGFGSNLAYKLRYNYYQYSPDAPLITTSEGVPNNYWINAEQQAQLPVASCSGYSVTFSGAHHITNVYHGITVMWGTNLCGVAGTRQFYIDGVVNATTVNVSLPTPTVSAKATTGTFTFHPSGFTKTITDIDTGIHEAPQGFTICYASDSNCNNNTFDPAQASHRCETVTVSGTGTALDSYTYVYDCENISDQEPFVRQLPSLSCSSSCGTASVIYDNNAVPGRNAVVYGPSTALNSFVSIMEAVICCRVTGIRHYLIFPNVNAWAGSPYTINGVTEPSGFGYGPKTYGCVGSSFGGNCGGIQLGASPHWENSWSVPNWHGGSMAGLLLTRNQDLLFQPATNSPHYGWMIDCGGRTGPNGNLTMCINVTDGVETRTFTFTPVAGQKTVEYVADDHSIVTKILNAGVSSDTISLNPGQVVFFASRPTFSIQQPTLSVRLADIPGAAKVVVRYGYDPYWLDVAATSVDCGAGTCTVPVDLAIGQPGKRVYRIQYLNASGAVLSTGDVQFF